MSRAFASLLFLWSIPGEETSPISAFPKGYLFCSFQTVPNGPFMIAVVEFVVSKP